MPGTKASGRPGGNPEFGKKYSFTTKRDEPLKVKIGLRITESMAAQLEELEDKNEFIRGAIAQALAQAQELEQGQLNPSGDDSRAEEPTTATRDEAPASRGKKTSRKKQKTGNA